MFVEWPNLIIHICDRMAGAIQTLAQTTSRTVNVAIHLSHPETALLSTGAHKPNQPTAAIFVILQQAGTQKKNPLPILTTSTDILLSLTFFSPGS